MADGGDAQVRAQSLWRHRDFMLLWTGSTVSELGSSVTDLALPLVAVVLLRATTFQVGLLTAASSAAFLLIALPAGAMVDRHLKRPLMLGADLARMAILASVPIAAWVGHVTLIQLYVVALTAGVLSVVFDVAYQSYLPALVTRAQLIEGNSKLSLPSSLAMVIGPSVAGGLVALLTAAKAIVVDAASFLFSACMIYLMRNREAVPSRDAASPKPSLRKEIGAGLSYVARHRVLRRIVACTATSNLFNAVRTAVIIVFMVRVLHAKPGTIGVVLSLGGIGGLVGGFTATWLANRLGTGRLLWLGKAALGWTALAIPLAQPGWGVLLVSFGLFFASISAMIYNVAQVSYRQAVCPPELLGRMNASVRWVIWGTLPLGALLGGWLGTAIGSRSTLVVSALGNWLAVLWIVLSPLVKLREIPVHNAYESASAGR